MWGAVSTCCPSSLLFLFFISYNTSQTNTASPPFSLLPSIYSSSIVLQKKAGLPVITVTSVSASPTWALLSGFYGAYFPGFLNPSCSYHPASPSFVGLPKLHPMYNKVSLGIISFIYFSYVWFYLGSLSHLAYSSWPFRPYWTWALSDGMVRLVFGWSFPQAPWHHCPSTSWTQDRLWIEGFVAGLVFQFHHWEPSLVVEDGWFGLHIPCY